MATPDAPPLTERQVEELIAALRTWAERHPAPDNPVISFAGSSPMTPRQLPLEVKERSTDGEAFLRLVQFGLEVMPFDEIVKRFVEPSTRG